MPRGRHSLPERPRSDASMLLVFVALSAAVIVAVWAASDSLVVEVGVTGIVVVIALAVALYLRASHGLAVAQWQEAVDRRRELVEVRRELTEVRARQVELLLEIRAVRADLAAVTEETARSLQIASDQR